MFDTTLGILVSWMAQGVLLMLGQAWQHPLLTTGLCLLLSFFFQADEQLRIEVYQELRERFRLIRGLFPFSLVWGKPRRRGIHSDFDYTIKQGPHTWSQPGHNQSPVNIEEQVVQRLAIRELLNWNHYDELPVHIVLENTGQTLLLRAKFRSNLPTISGADLLASYTFVELRFHWGWSNSEGSEHTLNHRKFPLEMQVMHRTGAAVPRSSTSSYDLLMIAYVFELSAHNPFLDPLMQNLKLVQNPGKRVTIPPFPLSYLIYPFRTGFYSYGGSLTQPPCYQGTEWFIFPESLAISDFQLRHFRQLLSSDGITPISRNSRPVQPLGNRIINLNYFCPYDATQLAGMRMEVQQPQDQKVDEQKDQSQPDQVQLQQQQQQLQQQQLHKQQFQLMQNQLLLQPQQQQLQQQPQQQQQQHQQQPQQPQPQQQQPQETIVPASSDDEGQLIETLNTTTTITTNSTASVCTTVLNKDPAIVPQQFQQQQPQQALPSVCPNTIIFFSSNSKSNINSNKNHNNNNNGGSSSNSNYITLSNSLESNSSEGDSSLMNKCNVNFQLDQTDKVLIAGVPICGIGDGIGMAAGGARLQLIE